MPIQIYARHGDPFQKELIGECGEYKVLVSSQPLSLPSDKHVPRPDDLTIILDDFVAMHPAREPVMPSPPATPPGFQPSYQLLATALIQQLGGAVYVPHADLNVAQWKSITAYHEEHRPGDILYRLE